MNITVFMPPPPKNTSLGGLMFGNDADRNLRIIGKFWKPSQNKLEATIFHSVFKKNCRDIVHIIRN